MRFPHDSVNSIQNNVKLYDLNDLYRINPYIKELPAYSVNHLFRGFFQGLLEKTEVLVVEVGEKLFPFSR